MGNHDQGPGRTVNLRFYTARVSLCRCGHLDSLSSARVLMNSLTGSKRVIIKQSADDDFYDNLLLFAY